MNSLRLIKGSVFAIVKLGVGTAPVCPIGYNAQLFTFNQASNCFSKMVETKPKSDRSRPTSKRQIKINKFIHILEQFQTLDHIPASETDKWKTIITDYQNIIAGTHPEAQKMELIQLLKYYTQFTQRLNEVFEKIKIQNKI